MKLDVGKTLTGYKKGRPLPVIPIMGRPPSSAPCGVFEGLSYHQEDEVIDPVIFADTVGLVNIIKKLISSNFMGVVRSFSVIFETGATYSCSSKK